LLLVWEEEMDTARSRSGGYILAVVIGASAGASLALVATRAIPSMMSRMMADMMANMQKQMGDEGNHPAGI
jgi:hypothetical protein